MAMKPVVTAETYHTPQIITIPSREVYGGELEAQSVYKPRFGAYLFFKRSFDIIASLLGLIVLAPLFLIVSAAIRIESEGKAIYKQTRIGRGGVPFMFYKFRSMQKDAEYRQSELLNLGGTNGPFINKVANDPRITRVGRFIRNTSIDELPQLYNILKGEMSFVGPRPLREYEVEQLTERQKSRHIVKGGLTCYWQISGRSNISGEERLEMDLKYIEDMSFKVDAKIFLKTFKVVLSRMGAC